MYYINRMKKTTWSSQLTQKRHWQYPTPFHNKNVRKPGPGNLSTAKIIFSGETLKPSLQRLGIRQQCPLSPLLFNTVLQFYPKYETKTTGNQRRNRYFIKIITFVHQRTLTREGKTTQSEKIFSNYISGKVLIIRI